MVMAMEVVTTAHPLRAMVVRLPDFVYLPPPPHTDMI
jgi:hypothetical protein